MLASHAQGFTLRVAITRGDSVYADTAVTVPAGNDLHALSIGHRIAATLMESLLMLGESRQLQTDVRIEGYGPRVPSCREEVTGPTPGGRSEQPNNPAT